MHAMYDIHKHENGAAGKLTCNRIRFNLKDSAPDTNISVRLREKRGERWIGWHGIGVGILSVLYAEKWRWRWRWAEWFGSTWFYRFGRMGKERKGGVSGYVGMRAGGDLFFLEELWIWKVGFGRLDVGGWKGSWMVGWMVG